MGLSTVTDLQRLKEFDKFKVDESIYGLEGKSHHLASLDIFVKIGSADDGVGTPSDYSSSGGYYDCGGWQAC